MCGGIAVPGVHFVAGTLSQIGRCAGQNIYRIPLFFWQQLRIIRVRFKDHHTRRINTVIVMQRVMGTPMGRIELVLHPLFFQVRIERGAAAYCLFLRRQTLDHATARIRRRCKIQNAHFLSCIYVRCCSFQSALWAYHSLRWFLINPMLWAIPVPSRACETLLCSTGILDCRGTLRKSQEMRRTGRCAFLRIIDF